jgi:enoyl-CoA hydratase/carnithine racemase
MPEAAEPLPPFETIRYEERDHVAILTLNRPERMNSVSRQMEADLAQVWARVRRSSEIWVVIVTGAGERAFCAGVDNFESRGEKETIPAAQRWFQPALQHITARQNQIYKPVICAVNGVCAGGGFYFVNDSDLVLCAENATFVDPHVTTGRVAALEPIGLTRRIPFAIVMEIALLGSQRRITAQRAYEVGLVNQVVPPAALLPTALELAGLITQNAPLAVQGTVEAIWKSLETGRQAAMDQGLIYATRNNATEDHLEGVRAFTEKRKPVWRGR